MKAIVALLAVLLLPATARADFVPAPGSPYTAGTQPFAAAVGDFDHDGRRDVAVVNESTDNVSILLGQAGGGFAAAAPVAAGDGPTAVVAADFNGDARDDLAVSAFNSDDVTILLRQAGGGFAAEGTPIA